MKELKTILERAVAEQASDIFLVAGRPVSVRRKGVIAQLDEESLFPPDTAALVKEIYRCANERDISGLETKGDDDFSFTLPGLSLNHEKVHDVILQGIVRTFQNVEVIRELSVLDNLLIAGHRQYTANLAQQALHLPILRQEEKVVRERGPKVCISHFP